jgi:hypothetical protein
MALSSVGGSAPLSRGMIMTIGAMHTGPCGSSRTADLVDRESAWWRAGGPWLGSGAGGMQKRRP